MNSHPPDRMVVIYDGQCPFCRSYVALMALRERVGAVDLIDARSDDYRVREAQARGHDLDEGMLVIHGGTDYYGADAVTLISQLSSRRNSLLARLLSNPARARRIYPFMKFGRNLTLRLLGRDRLSRRPHP